MMSTLTLVISGLLSITIFRSESSAHPSSLHYGIVIDCGSSGSRVYVYYWPPHSGNPHDLLNIQQLMDSEGKPVVKKVSPGKNIHQFLPLPTWPFLWFQRWQLAWDFLFHCLHWHFVISKMTIGMRLSFSLPALTLCDFKDDDWREAFFFTACIDTSVLYIYVILTMLTNIIYFLNFTAMLVCCCCCFLGLYKASTDLYKTRSQLILGL